MGGDAMTTPMPNVAEIRRGLSLFLEPGHVAELRILHTRRDTLAIHASLNPVRPDLLARTSNRVKEYGRETTADRYILNRRWFPLDFDAVRPTGISSTNAEHQATLDRARQYREWLRSQGWPERPIAGSVSRCVTAVSRN